MKTTRKAATTDDEKRRMLINFFGPDIAAKLLDVKAPASNTEPTSAADALVQSSRQADAYAAPGVEDLLNWGRRL